MRRTLLLAAIAVACSSGSNDPQKSLATRSLERVPALVDAHATRYVRTERGYVVPSQRGALEHHLDVTLPLRANQPLELARGAAIVRTTPLDVAAVAARIEDGAIVYPDVAPGSDLVLVAGHGRVEELRVLHDARAANELAWRLESTAPITSFRVRDGRVEALSDNDVVVLGTAPMLAYDARGTRRALDVRLDGDRLIATLDPRGLAYPIVVDPTWSAAASMKQARIAHTATVLKSGKILVVGGGATGYSDATSTAEIYDPGTNTWTLTGSMKSKRRDHAAFLTSSGKVIVAGGDDPTNGLSTVESWDPTTGTWTSLPAMMQKRAGAVGTEIGTKLFVAGGQYDGTNPYNNLAETYDPLVGVWLPATGGSSPQTRKFPNLYVWPSGNVMLTGGMQVGGSVLNTCDRYDATSGSWVYCPPLPRQSYRHSITSTAGGKVLFAGGFINVDSAFSDQTFQLDSESGSWNYVGMSAAVGWHVGQPLPFGKVLIAGGTADASAASGSAFVYDPATAISSTVSMATARFGAASVNLGPAKVLVAGGISATGVESSVEIYDTGLGCTVDSTCAPSGYCLGGVCATKLAVSGKCTANVQCDTGFCVDGFCCNLPCTGNCEVCAASLGSAYDGHCDDAPAGTDPRNKCPASGTSCGADGMCDGLGACRTSAPKGASCGVTACTAGSVSGKVCDGAGSCATSTVSCAPYACDAGGTACKYACASDAECSAGYRCVSSFCAPKAPIATPCATNGQCTSGFCVDGVCCDSACDGACVACAAILKGSGTDGTCGNVADGTDPRDRCATDTDPCKGDGLCDGAGACRAYAKAGTSCGESKCVDSVTSGKLCDGAGACADVPPTSCAPYTCDAADRVCRTACVSNFDCVSGYRCDATHTCVPKGPEDKRPRGDVCAEGSECQSGFCSDGVCCDTACDGQCEACDVKGSQGVCTAIDDKPHGKRPDCASGECGGVCDGIRRDTCTYPGSQVVCGNACTDGNIVTKVCNSKGACVDGALVSCQGFRCDGADKCQTSCATDIDCLGGYICESNVCLRAATPEPASSGGCGCIVAGSEAPRPAWLLLLGATVLVRRRRGRVER